MLKKIIITSITSQLLLGTVFAAGTALPADRKVTTTLCTMLNEDTQINLSNGVKGGYKCDVPNNVLAIGTCHPNGSRKQATVPCVGTDTNGDGTNDTWSPTGCSAATPSVVITSARGYTAYNTGGSVQTVTMDATCDDSTIAGKIN